MPNSLSKFETLCVATCNVDLWRIALDKVTRSVFLLSPDERQRADCFRREIDARRFMASRVALRKILSSYLQVESQEIRFSYNACGKPFVENSAWHFNLSHCEDVALIAIAKNRAVGVDIERVDEARALRMKSLLSPEDVEGDLTSREVCQQWVKLEALVKASGEGLSIPLPPIRVLESGYSMQTLHLDDGFVAVVALADEEPFDVFWKDFYALLNSERKEPA